MPSVPAAVDLVAKPAVGRVFSMPGRVRLSDVDRNGRMRLDATARFLQDVATDDASDAGLDRRYGWLVRRALIETRTPASIGEPIEVETWCTGYGRSWAERRSTITGQRGADIDAVSLWVQVDIATGRPARIADDFIAAYGEASAGRSVSARLQLSPPDERARECGSWAVRRTDLDPFGHVNNAATWAFLEEAARLDESGRRGRAELEYVQPIERVEGSDDDRIRVLTGGDHVLTAWLVSADATLAAGRWRGADS